MRIDEVKASIISVASNVDYWNIRYMAREDEFLSIHKDILQAPQLSSEEGTMITVFSSGGMGYASTTDLSRDGLHRAFKKAKEWAELSSKWSIFNFQEDTLPVHQGSYRSPVAENWFQVSLKTKLDLLKESSEKLRVDGRIVDWRGGFWGTHWENFFYSSTGSEQHQTYQFLHPTLGATAFGDGISETRTFGGSGVCRQGGFEVLDQVGFRTAASTLGDEALELLAAPQCPTGIFDILLFPDQMILQIHESIGHPLELDRILGDERNYAGTSFVSKDMFGHYRYGSDLLNVSFDPGVDGEFASYGYDDDGDRASKTYLIQNGILKAGLGGVLSQKRLGVPGVANSRAVSWNRPPIDRMANLNLEVGSSSLDEMISQMEEGVIMKTNCSWSIDDSRNKFQFGCEYGQRVKNGEIIGTVRKPNYRGISSQFWRGLAMVGNQDTLDILGTPYCGKGEPNQSIAVGHASPACLFQGVETFGGE